MRKRRERRKNPATGVPIGRQPSVPPETYRRFSLFCALLTVSILVSVVICTIVYGHFHRGNGASSSITYLSVHERGLVKPNIAYHEILNENSRAPQHASPRHFQHPILAYVTPWNSKGYDMAKKYSSKLTHISPVWYELKSEASNLILVGQHNADIRWISEVKQNGDSLILPRVVLEALPTEFLRKKKAWEKAINLILTECERIGYDGVVLESWSRWAAYGILQDSNMRNLALQFVKQLGEKLHSTHSREDESRTLELVYVIPAPSSQVFQPHDFSSEDLQTLSQAVDWFSLMTYDFSNPQYPGPNAPLNWIRSSLRLLLNNTEGTHQKLAHKILLGVNFYGNDFKIAKELGGGPITGPRYVELLAQHRPALQWDDDAGEHFFVYLDNRNHQHAVFYPSLMSLSVRLDEARLWGTGLSIWEIGHGLECFFDLF